LSLAAAGRNGRVASQHLAERATFRLIEARKAQPSHARNIGVANAHFDWIAFTDPSQRLEPEWLAKLIEIAHSDPETGVVVGNLDPETDSLFEQCAAIASSPTRHHTKMARGDRAPGDSSDSIEHIPLVHCLNMR